MDLRPAATIVSGVAELAALARRVPQLPWFSVYVFAVLLRHGIWFLGGPTTRPYLYGYVFTGWLMVGFKAAAVLELGRLALAQYPGLERLLRRIVQLVGGGAAVMAFVGIVSVFLRVRGMYGGLIAVLAWADVVFFFVCAGVVMWCAIHPAVQAVRWHGLLLAGGLGSQVLCLLLQEFKVLRPEIAGTAGVLCFAAAYAVWAWKMPAASWEMVVEEPRFDPGRARADLESFLTRAREAR